MTENSWMMQYPITLPRDYDMQIIRDRVRSAGSVLDGRKGLLFKAYGIREHGVDGSPVNQYAPFYVWSSASAAAEFLAGERALFPRVIESFGRPRIRTWLPVAGRKGPLSGEDVSTATHWLRRLPAAEDLIKASSRLAEDVAALSALPIVHRAVAGIDPNTWEATLFVTSASRLPDQDGGGGEGDGVTTDRFQVLHLSEGAALKRMASDCRRARGDRPFWVLSPGS